MKTSNINNDDFDRCPFHSDINAGNDIDLVYKKTYCGDWGHWDDLPEDNAKEPASEKSEVSNIPAEGLCS